MEAQKGLLGKVRACEDSGLILVGKSSEVAPRLFVVWVKDMEYRRVPYRKVER